ncbi:thymidylate synthase [Roseobacter phage CRP-143]|nr:thymidylate synthase [Roseobacter phage CRP-143]
MKVELSDCAGGDLSVVNSARVSFNKEVKEMTVADEKLINYLAKHRHDTPFRHNFIQLRCSVPLFLARQLMKHQAGLTWNEESRRYVDTLPYFDRPTEWLKLPEGGIKQGSGGVHPENDYIRKWWASSVADMLLAYDKLIEADIAPEMARMVLPQNMMVNFIWSGNLLAFFHVYSLRSGEGAQQEAKEFAALLKAAIEPEFSTSWAALEARG